MEPGRHSGTTAEEEGRGLGADSVRSLWIPWIALGEIVPLLGVHLGEEALPLRGQKESTGATGLCSLAQEQRHLLRAASLDAGTNREVVSSPFLSTDEIQ